ncbi:MAG: hypothetical protein PHE68_06265, partial [Candidatus Peribacteraceae bacterium]|nr:hypothetical protein [Candidatus Peribacteraceae bacterium]
MAPEKPSPGVAENGERSPEFVGALHSFGETLGPEVEKLPAELTNKWIEDQLKDIEKDHRVDTYNEQTRHNELLYRQAALQRLKDLQDEKNNKKIDPTKLKELIVADQAVAYHEYFREAQNNVLSVLRRYETLRKNVPAVPQKILAMEADTARYISVLDEATKERVAFSNILLLDQHIAQRFGDAAQLQGLRETSLAQLSRASKAALLGGEDQRLIRANQINQRIIDILAGKHGLQGIEKGYVPKRMFLELLKFQYKRILDQQIEIARDPALTKARAEIEQLQLKHVLADHGKGEFTENDKVRYDELQARIKGVNAQYKELGEKRGEITKQIVALTQDLGEYNIAQTELAAIQEQFGKKYSFEGVQGVSPLTTPPEIRDAIAANMETRKKHHLGQIDAFLNTVEKDVLDKGLRVRMEHLWNEKGRDAMREITHRMAAFFTFAVPETFGLKEAAKDALTEPLDSALGWPAGKDDWDKLTVAEKEVVQKKSMSILDLIEKFDRSKAKNFHETVQLAQRMKPASASAMESIQFDEAGQAVLPQDRVTSGNINALIAAHGESVVSLMLMRQLQGDFGTGEPPTGFMGAYSEFLKGVNANIDIHLDVGRALNILGKRYDDMMKWLLIAAGMGLAVGVAGTIVVLKVAGKSVRTIGGGIWRGARGLARLPGKILPGSAGAGAAVEAPVAAAEATAEALPTATRSVLAKYLGPTAIILTAWELKNAIQLAASLESLQDLKAVDAAIELMETHPAVNRDVPGYRRDLALLRKRRELIAIRDVMENLTVTLEIGAKSYDPERALALAKRGNQLAGFARQQDRDAH